MHSFTQATGSQMAEMGHQPTSFWINSMGEYGHLWDADGTTVESVGGSINLHGLTTEADQQRAFRDALHAELVHPAEFALHRLWTLFEPLGSDLWRFYASIEYGPSMREDVKVAPKAHVVDMNIEYQVPRGRAHLLDAAAQRFGAKVEHMIDHPGDDGVAEQYAIAFDVRGKSVAEVADLQVRWLLANDDLHQFSVSVI